VPEGGLAKPEGAHPFVGAITRQGGVIHATVRVALSDTAKVRTPVRKSATGAAGCGAGHRLEALALKLRSLHAAAVGREDGDRAAGRERFETPDEQKPGLQVHGLAAKGVLGGSTVVDIERNDPLDSNGLEELRHIAHGDWIAALGLTVLAGIQR
jgi:hypothetical protein